MNVSLYTRFYQNVHIQCLPIAAYLPKYLPMYLSTYLPKYLPMCVHTSST